MSELAKCTRCRKVMIDEEFDNHRCLPNITGFKTIKYADCYTVQDSQNQKITTFRAMDGMVYDFVEIPEDKEHTKIPYQPRVNMEKTTDDETEPDFSIVLYYALRKSRYNGICLRCFTSSQTRQRS